MDEPIYLDYSTLTTFQTCKEMARLSFKEHLRPIDIAPALDFGQAFHKGAEALYLTGSIESAETAFIGYCRESRAALPLSIESDEKRSIERGLYILRAYHQKWKDEPYELVRIGAQGYTEVRFKVLWGMHKDQPVYIVGSLDRVMRSKITGRLWNWEMKTTSMGLTQFQTHCKPNHQVSLYHWALAESFGMDIAGTIWDCIFISSRQPSKALPTGVDPAKDFARVETRRSERDIDVFKDNLASMVGEYLAWSHIKGPWTQNAPKACFMYGGCQYLEICRTNWNPQIISSLYKVEPWEPWKAA